MVTRILADIRNRCVGLTHCNLTDKCCFHEIIYTTDLLNDLLNDLFTMK